MIHLLHMKQQFYFIFTPISIVLAVLSTLFFESTFLGILSFGIFAATQTIGMQLFVQRTTGLSEAAIFTLSYYTVIFSLIYYMSSMHRVLFSIVLVAASAIPYIVYILPRRLHTQQIRLAMPTMQSIIGWLAKNPLQKFLTIIIGGIFTICLHLAHSSAFDTPTRSLYEYLSPYFFPFFILGVLLTVIYAWHSRKTTYVLTTISLLACVGISIAPLIYSVGYGFDPFIHQATEQHILEHGSITPKPLYYIGHYMLVILTSHITNLDISLIDSFIVPLLFTLFLPLFVFKYARTQLMASTESAHLSAYALLFMPLAPFISSTPQSLAFVFFLMVLCIYPTVQKSLEESAAILIPYGMTAIAAAFIHPLAGIPAVLFVAFVILKFYLQQKSWPQLIKKILILAFSLVASIALPFTFIFEELLRTQSLSLPNVNAESLNPLLLPHTFEIITRYNSLFDIIYTVTHNNHSIILLIAVVTIIYNFFKKRRDLSVFSRFLLILFINYILLRLFVSFDLVIDYEQNAYAERVLTLCVLTSFFILLQPFVEFLHRMRTLNFGMRLTAVITILFLGVSSVYAAYPRSDGYVFNGGYNVSYVDLVTTDFIHDHASINNIADYIVLANQNVSVANLSQFGFAKYYTAKNNEQLYYYPIPTSSPLYSYYLTLVEKTQSPETINDAIRFMNAEHAYVVINDYWAHSAEIINTLKSAAFETIEVEKEGTKNTILFFKK